MSEIRKVIKEIQEVFKNTPVPDKFYVTMTRREYRAALKILGYSKEEIAMMSGGIGGNKEVITITSNDRTFIDLMENEFE